MIHSCVNTFVDYSIVWLLMMYFRYTECKGSCSINSVLGAMQGNNFIVAEDEKV